MANLDDLRRLARSVHDANRVLDELRRQRDDLIREVRQTTAHTVPEIAEAAGVSPATVKSVIRGIR